ncbi:hypothetical protein BP5796_09068 [Coleophoma crateriformis]|uniref:Uncharacterized protein n=1 Tax=Coleophoma crateriformis TaxID=565419 RepID=A0A3D8R3C5_9HELO|nr:hypothetical protein BP5796_09068 [Coleophoma crateriformis]
MAAHQGLRRMMALHPESTQQVHRPALPPSPDILMLESSEAEYWLSVSSEYSPSGTSYLDANMEKDGSYVFVSGNARKTRASSDETVDVAGESISTLSNDDVEMEFSGDKKERVEERETTMCQKEVLAELYTAQPQPVHNVYDQADTVSTVSYNTEYSQEGMNYCTLDSQFQPDPFSITATPITYSLPSRPMTMTQVATLEDSPWIPLVEEYRTQYPAGYVAFLPKLVPAGLQPTQTVLQGQPTSESSIPIRREKKKPSSSHALPKTKSKGEEVTQALVSWEHIVIQRNGLHKLGGSDNAAASRQRRHGHRKGKLTREAANKAKIIRGMKSCWRCWNLKIPVRYASSRHAKITDSMQCSEDEVCKACIKHCSAPSPANDQLCCRTGFDEYESAFFPEYLSAHLKKKSIEDLISEHTSGFYDNGIDVDVTTGASFKPMRLSTNFFRAESQELLLHHYLGTNLENKDLLVQQCSAPVGLLGVDVGELKKKCQQYIEDMIGNPLYAEQSCADNSTEVPRRVLEVIQRYISVKDQPLIRKAMMLHAINYSMSRLVTFSEDSAARLAEQLGDFPVPYISSRLLNRQIKYAMHKLHRELTREVLKGLEKSMRAKSRDSWGPSFCTILILSLCIEDLQTAADTFVVCDLVKDGIQANLNRGDSFTACSALEEYPYQRCTRLFHDIYHSHRQAGGRVKDGAFNPIKNRCEIDAHSGWDKHTAGMTLVFQDLVSEFDAEMKSLSERPLFLPLDTVVLPAMIRKNNTGRLVSQFLLSFL